MSTPYTETTATDRPSVQQSAPSVGELLSEVTRDVSTLMRQEVALAKAELREEAQKTGKAAGMLGAAGYAGHLTILFLSIALWMALSDLLDSEGWAALIVAVLWGIAAAVLASSGRAKLKKVHGPERTVQTVKEIPDALKPSN